MSKGSIVWDKLVNILLALIVLFFLLMFIFFLYVRLTKTEVPWI